jgi:hypothetical protein
MPLTLDEAATEFANDLCTVMADNELSTEEAKAVMMKYARLLMIRETLPSVLLAMQYHVQEPKAKEGIAAALRILALTRGVVLPKP